MSLKKRFGTDNTKVNEGVWISVGDNDDGKPCRFKLARMSASNRKFAKSLAKHRKGMRRRPGEDIVESQKRMVGVFVDTILLDWENVEEYRDGATEKYIAFNRDNAVFLLNDLPDLFDLLTDEASQIENFQAAEDEEDAKN